MGGSQELKEITTYNHLGETFRYKYPNKLEYSWENNGCFSKSRIDRFYISNNMLETMVSIDFHSNNLSDHKVLCVKIQTDEIMKRGRGYWKCNTQILSHENVKKGIFQIVLDAKNNFELSSHQWWENCKTRFKQFLIKYSKKFSKMKFQKFKILTENLPYLMIWKM